MAILTSAHVAGANPIDIVEGWIAQGESYEWVTISHGGVEHDEASGTTTVTDLTIEVAASDLPGMSTDTTEADEQDSVDFSYVFTFPSLAFEGLESDGDYYRAAAIRADTLDLEFTVESVTQGATASAGTYDGISIINPRWARLPDIGDDPARPISRFYPLAAALVDVSFDAAEFGTLELVSQSSDPQVTTVVIYGAGSVGPTDRGNMTGMEMGEIIVSVAAANGSSDEESGSMDFDMVIGGMEVDTYNYGDIIRLFDPELEPGSGNEPFETVAGTMSVYDWGISAEGADITIGDLRMEDLGARRPTQPILSRADELYIESIESGEEPDAAELVELVSAFYGAFRLGLMEVREIEGTSEDFSGALASAGIAGLSAEGIESIHYRGFEASDSAGDVEVRLGDFTISDFRFPSLAALIGFEAAQEEGDIDTMLAAIPTLGGISISDLLVNVPFLAELSLTRGAFEMSDHVGPIPTRIRNLIEGLRMPTWMLDDETFEVLDGLGYEEIGTSSDLQLVWQETDQTVSLASESSLEDGGRIKLTATLGGIPREALENPMSLMFLAFAMTLHEATLEFEDDSLTERALAMFARDQGMDVGTMRAQALGILPFVAAPLQRPDFLMALTSAASTFLNDPGTVRMTMIPEAPVPIMQLMEASESDDPGLIIDLLNIQVSAE